MEDSDDFDMKPPLAPRVSQTDPTTTRCAWADKLLVGDTATVKRMPWPIEKILTDNAKICILTIK